MTKAKSKGLLVGSRKKAIMKKIHEMKWNQSFNNTSINDVKSFYEKRIRNFRSCNQSLRENNESLAKSLADQKATAQLWYNETVSLKNKLLDYHEKLVTYQLTDAGKQEEAIVAETERRLAAFVAPINAAIKSGIDNALAVADDLENMKALTQSISNPKTTLDLQQKSPRDSSFRGLAVFPNNITMGLPPLIQRTSLLSSECDSASFQQKKQKLSEILREEKMRSRELLQCNNAMSDIEEMSSSDESSPSDEHSQVAETVRDIVVVKRKSPETKNLRRSKRQTKIPPNFRLYLDASSDSDEESRDVFQRPSIESISSASSLSDFEKHKRSGSFVSTRTRNTRSNNRVSKDRKTSMVDCLAISFDSPLKDANSSSEVSTPQTCNKGILITPSPLTEQVSMQQSRSSPTILGTSMEFTACETHSIGDSSDQGHVGNHSIDDLVYESPIRQKKKWFTRKDSCDYESGAKKSDNTPYDTMMIEVSPNRIEVPTFPRTMNDSARSLDLPTDDCGPQVSSKMEANKENTPLRRTTRQSRRNTRLSGHVDSPAMPSTRKSVSFEQFYAHISPPVKIKVERASSICPVPIESVSTNVKEPPSHPEVAVFPSRRQRRTAVPVSYVEPSLLAKRRQGDAISSTIYSEVKSSTKGRSGMKKK